MIRLAQPWALLLLPVVAAVAIWLWSRRREGRPRMAYSSVALMGGVGRTLRSQLLWLPMLLNVLCCLLIVAALARPQVVNREHKRFTEGIDIMLVIDVSQSMQALDFTPNRLEKAKEVVAEFVDGRTDDRIGVVVFGRESFALCPLTRDYSALGSFISRIDFELVPGDRTAIGMGLANAVNRLRKSAAKSKVAILLTDGENNAGRIDPISAAEVAKEFNVRVYTIGVGSERGVVRIPLQLAPNRRPVIQTIPAELNVGQLTEMAEMTGAQFFHATDDDSLEQIYEQIDKMERTKVEISETHYFDELGHFLMLPALGLLLMAFAMETTWLRTFP